MLLKPRVCGKAIRTARRVRPDKRQVHLKLACKICSEFHFTITVVPIEQNVFPRTLKLHLRANARFSDHGDLLPTVNVPVWLELAPLYVTVATKVYVPGGAVAGIGTAM